MHVEVRGHGFAEAERADWTFIVSDLLGLEFELVGYYMDIEMEEI